VRVFLNAIKLHTVGPVRKPLNLPPLDRLPTRVLATRRGAKVAHLLLKTVRDDPRAEHFYLELDVADEGYLSGLFEDIIHHSKTCKNDCPGPGIQPTARSGAKVFPSAIRQWLVDGSGASGWAADDLGSHLPGKRGSGR